MTVTLPAFLATTAAAPRSRCPPNCLFWPADWIKAAHGVDPAAPFRGYASLRKWAALLRSHGGAAAVADRACAAAGLHRVERPATGDIAVVLAPALRRGRPVWRERGAICVAPERFAVLTLDKGLVIAGPPALSLVAAWSLRNA